MPPLRTADKAPPRKLLKDRYGWLFAPWLNTSMALFFVGLLVFPSRNSFLNVLDALFFLPAAFLLLREGRRIWLYLSHPFVVPVIIFLGWAFLTLSWADDPNYSRTIRGALEIIILFAFFIWMNKTREHDLRRALEFGGLTTAVIALAVMLSFYSEAGITRPLYDEVKEIPLGLPAHNTLIATMIMITPTFILLAATRQHGRSARGWLLLAGGLICLTFIILLQRRTGMVAAGLGLATMAILSRSRALILTLAALALAATVLLVFDVNHYLSRGSTYRLAHWELYLDLIFEHPFLGIGLDQAAPEVTVEGADHMPFVVAHPHNIYLSTWLFTGIIGLLLFLFIWLRPLWHSLRHRLLFDRARLIFFAPAVPGAVTMMFDGAFPVVPVFANWMCIWVPLALLAAGSSTTPQGQSHHNANPATAGS